MDDVLNLRGIYWNESDKAKMGTELKTLGEHITAGKATMPVAKAMAMLTRVGPARDTTTPCPPWTRNYNTILILQHCWMHWLHR
jgi:hypothetical protein